MEKLETRLGKEFLNNLRKSCTSHHERIEAFKIHGEQYQQHNLPDYFICFRGRFIGLEFKVAPNEAERRQIDQLLDIIDAGGVGIIVEFITTEPVDYVMTDAYSILVTCLHTNKTLFFKVNYDAKRFADA